MWKRVGRVIINNFGLKVLAVVFAIILWLAIVNVEDPDKSATFTIPVQIVNADYLTDQGKVYEVLDNTDIISFTVEGKRSIVENLTEDDFRATANVENIDDSLSMVPITLTATSYSSQLELTTRSSYLMLDVQDLVSREYEIQVETNGQPSGTCFVESMEVTPNTVTVSGPQSVVDEIDGAWVVLDIAGAEESVSSTEEIVLANANGNAVDTENLTLDVTQAEVTVDILMRKQLPITFEVTGEPADGWWYAAPECEVDTVVLEGDPALLGEMEEFTVGGTKLDVADAEADVTVTLSTEDFLPEGIRLAEDQPEKLVVTLPIVPAVEAEVQLSADAITITGLEDGMDLVIHSDPVTVVLTGTEDDLTRMNANRLDAVLDVSGLEPGDHVLTFHPKTDGTYKAEATISVTITQ